MAHARLDRPLIGVPPMRRLAALLLLATLLPCAALAQGTVQDGTTEASAANLDRSWRRAQVALPASLAPGRQPWLGRLEEMPAIPAAAGRAPVLLFMHGSSGLAPFMAEFQRWVAAELGLASVAPDSLAIAGRLTYTSPVPVAVYERIHALRSAELASALDRLRALPWVDPGRIAVGGTSEGSVPVARLGAEPPTAARLVFAWSCERNYFVEDPRTAIPPATPVLNVIATRDPFFSAGYPPNAGFPVRGNCAAALAGHADALVVQPVTDRHTLINDPPLRPTIAAFLRRTLRLP